MANSIIGEKFENRKGYIFEVVESVKVDGVKKYKVRFLDSGYETVGIKSNILIGRVADKSKSDWSCRDYKLGDVIENVNGVKAIIRDFTSVKINDRKRMFVHIEFLETGYKTICNTDAFIAGNTKDYLSPSVHGVGMIGYVDNSKTRLREMQEYRLWAEMIRRCYCKGNDSYNSVEVCERWKRFDYFLEDVVHIEGYEKWKDFKENNPSLKNVYELDKDTKIEGSKIYSLETCRFLHKKYNAGFTSWASKDTKTNIIETIKQKGEVS